jgi:hypothetical protein
MERRTQEQEMKVTLGYRNFGPEGVRDLTYGTVESTANGLELSGDVETLRIILERARGDLPGVRQVRLAQRKGPFSDSEVLHYLLKTFSGMTSWFKIEDTAAREAFEAMKAAYMEWDHAWSQTIHTTGLRSFPLLYGLPGDAEYLHQYDHRYTSQMTAEQRDAFTRYATAFQAWVEASS